jgi:DNA adenine methylase
MRPPFSYYGGKQRMASKIIPYIPKHTVYVEPFCGSATLFFRKPWPNVTNSDHYREYINDKNELVINFFKQLALGDQKLIDYLNVIPLSESEHKKATYICKNPEKHNETEKAIGFYTSIQQSFSNVLNSGWGRGVYSRNLQATWSNNKDLTEYVSRMQSVGITCRDALTIIKQYDSSQTFFYCDPPYPNTDQGYYSGYTESDLKNLIDLLTISKGSAIISCYNHDHLFDPDVWKKAEFNAVTSSKGRVGYDRSKKGDESSQNRKRTEVIYIKQSDKPRPEIQKLYDSGKFDCFEGREGDRIPTALERFLAPLGFTLDE